MIPWKPTIFFRILALIGAFVISSCAFRLSGKSANPVQGEFNLTKGTRRVYLYSEYQPSPSDPNQVITSQNQLTETVTETSSSNGLFLAHVQRQQKPLQVPAEWMPSPSPGEFWYIVQGQQVFKSNVPVDLSTVDTDMLLMAFDFPLSVNENWCPIVVDLKDPSHPPIKNCDNAGKQSVLKQSTYQVPAGRFEDCFQIVQFFNDGNFIQWFCKEVGVVEIRFDHSGTRFGFKQELTGYTRDSP